MHVDRSKSAYKVSICELLVKSQLSLALKMNLSSRVSGNIEIGGSELVDPVSQQCQGGSSSASLGVGFILRLVGKWLLQAGADILSETSVSS